MWCLKVSLRVAYLPDRTIAKHFEGMTSAGLKPKLVIDQRHDARSLCGVGHLASFDDIHRHRLFTEDVFAVFDRGERHLVVKHRRRGYANKVDIVARNRFAPVVGMMRDLEFLRRASRVFDAAARDRYDLRALTRDECRYLNLTREPTSNDADTNLVHICKVRTIAG
jgi:hypothetical protein